MRFCTIGLVVTLALGVGLERLAAEAQQAGKVPRIGVLSTSSPSSNPRFLEAFRQGLRELGYVEGQNISIVHRYAEGKLDRLPDLAAELVRLNADIIVAGGTQPALAAKRTTTTIPIVMATGGDPVGTGLVASLARPGGNVTGLSDMTVDLSAKRLELLKQVIPRVSRVAILWNPTNPTNPLQLREAQVAAQTLRLTVQSLKVSSFDEFEQAFAAMAREHANAFVVLADPFMLIHHSRLADLAARVRLPGMYPLREHAEAGGLISYGPSLADNFRRAATYVDKILKGAKPADLPVEQPTKFELVINLKTAKALGLTIPASVLVRADQVIE